MSRLLTAAKLTKTRRNIAFHPASVVFETPSHAELLEKTGVRALISGVIDELLAIARAQGCQFNPGYREEVMEQMILPSESTSTMYQDFLARRPMEVETYLGSPMKLAQEVGVPVPRIETLYALLHNVNTINQTRPPPSFVAVATAVPPPMPRMSSAPSGPAQMPPSMRGSMPGPGPMGRGPMGNGMPPRNRAASAVGGPMPPGMRRGPPPMNGYPPRGMNGNGYGPRGPPPRRSELEETGLEEFSHVMLYDDMVDDGGYDMSNGAGGDIHLREREFALRQKELALREREFRMRQGQGRMAPAAYDDDDDEDGADFFDPMAAPSMAGVDADQIDMMSVTSRRTRKAPSAGQLRANPEMMGMGGQMRNSRNPPRRPGFPKNRTSTTLMNEMPHFREELMNNPLMGYSSDRYGNVDRHNMGIESRTNSLTAERLHELQQGAGHGPGPNGFGAPFPGPGSRRGSHSPANLLNGTNGSITPRPNLRPSPPSGSYNNGRPSPPGLRQPIPRYPTGGPVNGVMPHQQLEQQSNGVSNVYPAPPPKAAPSSSAQLQPQVRSLTGSASASAGSGDSYRSSAPLDSDPSAHSSSSSLGPRHVIGVR